MMHTIHLKVSAAVLLALLPLGAAAVPVDIRFARTDAMPRVGAAFAIEVRVDLSDTGGAALAFGFDLVQDPSWMLAGVAIGPAFPYDDSGRFAATDVAGAADPFIGGPRGADILLATLSFTATAPGVFAFGIDSDLGDPNEGLFTTAARFDLTHLEAITIAPTEGGVPLPATEWLLATGLAGLAGLRQSRARGDTPRAAKR